jgi:hypothetical protein
MRTLLISCLLLLAACLRADEATYTVIYSDAFHRHYPVRGRDFDLARYDLEPATVIWDASRQRKITVLRTRGDRYPYEDQKCIITVEGTGLNTPRVLSATYFRTVEASWITEKLILIKLDIGHAAGVHAIYDAEKDSWIYRESVEYTNSGAPDGLGPGSQPDRAETNRTSSPAGSRR